MSKNTDGDKRHRDFRSAEHRQAIINPKEINSDQSESLVRVSSVNLMSGLS
jgi:hypothetical protein